jgi:hypothetical protein
MLSFRYFKDNSNVSPTRVKRIHLPLSCPSTFYWLCHNHDTLSTVCRLWLQWSTAEIKQLGSNLTHCVSDIWNIICAYGKCACSIEVHASRWEVLNSGRGFFWFEVWNSVVRFVILKGIFSSCFYFYFYFIEPFDLGWG